MRARARACARARARVRPPAGVCVPPLRPTLAARPRHPAARTYNLACLLTGATSDDTYKGQGVRINSTKYTLLRDLGKQTFAVKLEDGSTPNVTIDSVRVLKSRDSGLVLASKGPYYFAAKYKSDPRADPSMPMAERLATGFYW